jgi:hypothetical protein
VSWLLAAHVLIILAAAVLISANRKPAAAIAWILAIILVPVVGVVFFMLVGFGKLPRRRRDKQREVCQAVLARTTGLDQVGHRDEWPSWLASMVTMNRNLGSLPMVGGNSAELIDSYEGSIKSMADAVDQADEFVHVEFFISCRTRRPRPSSMPSSGRVDEEFRCAFYLIMSRNSCIQTERQRSVGSPTWLRSIGQCCRSNRCEGIGVGQIFATTGSLSWWTAPRDSRVRRT